MIFLIAVLHALPVFAAAWFSSNKAALWGAALVSALVAVGTGNPAYLAVDLLAIGVALWNCLKVLKRRTRREEPPAIAPPPKPELGGSDFLWIGMAMLVGLFAFLFALPQSNPSSPPAPPTSSVQAPTVQVVPSKTLSEPQPWAQKVDEPARQRESVTVRAPRTSTAERCLRIYDEKKMVACLETVK